MAAKRARRPVTEKQRETLRRNGFQPGQSGNPAGRKLGSRNKLAEAFLADMLKDWTDNGKATIEKVRQEDPSTYLRVAASLLPKQVDVTSSLLDDLRGAEDDDLRALLTDVLREAGIRVDSRGVRRLLAGSDEEGCTTH